MTFSIRLRIAFGLSLIVATGAVSLYLLYDMVTDAAELVQHAMPDVKTAAAGGHDMWLVHVRLAQLLDHARTQLVVLLSGFLLLSIIAAGALMRSIARPFRRLSAGIGALASGDWQHRLAESGPKEFAEVARQFNRLASERQAVESERARLAQAVEQAAEIVMVTKPDGTIVYVNPAFERVSGYTRAEVVGHSPRLVSSGLTDPVAYRDLWRTIQAGRVWQGELTNRRKDGTIYVERQTISPVRDKAGQIEYFVSIGADITAQQRLEIQLSQAAKMEAIGRLAGGVAHDFNNLLMVISGACEKLNAYGSQTAGSRESVDVIARAADKAASLTRRLLAFSRQQVMQPRAVHLNEVVGGMDQILRRIIGEDVQVVTLLAEDLPLVMVDPSQVEQVVLNLAVNARQAMPGGGGLLIQTERAVFDDTAAAPDVNVRPGVYVRLTVSDTGTGMDAHTQAHLFEPFFTTKGPGEGTGLGLSTVYGVISQCGGHIQVFSEPGHGTTFHVYLPACGDGRAVAQDTVHATPVPAPGGTILLVEDDEDVRALLSTALSESGYRVLVAGNGLEGLARAADHAGCIDLLVTDIVMPRLGGVELAHTLAAARPSLRVLYLTGYAPEGVSQGRLVPGARCLRKPVSMSVLLQQVAEILTDRPDMR